MEQFGMITVNDRSSLPGHCEFSEDLPILLSMSSPLHQLTNDLLYQLTNDLLYQLTNDRLYQLTNDLLYQLTTSLRLQIYFLLSRNE